MKKLENRYDHEKLLSVLHNTNIRADQVHVSSPTGNEYLYPSGDLMKHGLNQNDFTVINEEFVGTYVEEVYNDLNERYDICRGRFMTMSPNNRAYSYHYDISKRLHIPLTTDENCMFIVDDELYKASELGALYELDATKKHTALNLGNNTRTHFVVCLKANSAIDSYMKRLKNATSA